MWMLKSCSTVVTAALALPCEYAASILALPPVDSGTQRSRGIDSMTTCLVVGLTLARIIDWVRIVPPNLASLSEASSSTVKGAPGGATTGGCDAAAEAVADAFADGRGEALGRMSDWPVSWIAVTIAGMKNASAPTAPDTRKPSAISAAMNTRWRRTCLRRRTEARCRLT